MSDRVAITGWTWCAGHGEPHRAGHKCRFGVPMYRDRAAGEQGDASPADLAAVLMNLNKTLEMVGVLLERYVYPERVAYRTVDQQGHAPPLEHRAAGG